MLMAYEWSPFSPSNDLLIHDLLYCALMNFDTLLLCVTFGDCRCLFFSGMYYDKHLKYIRLNSDFVPFTNMDLSFLQKVSAILVMMMVALVLSDS